jgi:hypothetical protein
MSIFDSIMSTLGLAEPDPDAEQIAPVVIVKILDSVPLTGIDQGTTLTLDALKTQAAAPDSAAYTALAGKFSGLVFGWAFTSFSATNLTALISRATEADPTYVAPKFDRFFEIVCDLNFDVDGLAAALNDWTDVIEYAYADGEASDPVITGTTNPLFSGGKQGYFSPAPVGIGVAAAWAKGADGTGVNVIDIENGWFTKQEDLPPGFAILNPTNNLVQSQAHGAAVVGIIAGQDNALGIIGAAPAVNIAASSYNDPKAAATAPVNVQRVHDRIVNAAIILPAGSILLLEVQIIRRIAGVRVLVPVEAAPLAFESMRLAITTGLVVVEAAGNGHTNLETWVMDVGPNKGKKTLSRATPADFQDSGAIMVGAGSSTVPHTRLPFSNFGSRVDCYAWGKDMVTTGWDSAQPAATNIYWGVNLIEIEKGVPKVQFFGGTSGASPVIVGCAALLQHLSSLLTRKDGKTGRFDPPTMRTILSDPNNGTACADPIGVMPDFQQLLANIFTP